MLLAITLLLVCIIGYLAQSIGLCMVRGVNEFKSGKPEFLIAILLSGVLAWVAILFSSYMEITSNFKTHDINIIFAIGGVLFGFGAAFNQGCGVSTLSKLSRGDFKMLFTILGWLIGWTVLANWTPSTKYNELVISSNVITIILFIFSLTILIWVFLGKKERRKLWLTMMCIGLIGGFVFLFDPKWPPSGLLHIVSRALISPDTHYWPPQESYFLFISLLLGMFLAAWQTNNFTIVKSNWNQWLTHIMAGTFMGIGASLALGGNDTQLLLALPTFSPGGAVAVLGMLIGIWIGLWIKEKSLVKT